MQVDSRKEEKEAEIYKNSPQIIEEPNIKERIKYDNEKKFKLVQLEQQARNGGTGFMERLKRAWNKYSQNLGM